MVMQFEKPAAGSWTKAYPDLGTGLISYEDSISPEFYELEREAIFRRTWLNIGRVEQVPKKGSYFTKELAVCDTSIVVVRGQDDTIRAFHNMCRHRGNKLVWQDYPNEEVSGTCRQFTCKYHGWRYALDGELTFIQQEHEFFDLDKSDFPLVEVNLDVWEGFIFVNLDKDPERRSRSSSGELSGSFEGYPFSELTQVFSYSAEVGSNWKLFIDAFQEFYHAPVLHVKQSPASVGVPMMEAGFEAIHYSIHGDHRVVSTGGSRMDTAEVSTGVREADRHPLPQRPVRSVGPRRDQCGLLSPGMNPSQHPAWGLDSFQFFPNFVILVWEPGWYLTYHYWPTSVELAHLRGHASTSGPRRTRASALAQELAAVTFKEFALQDGNTLEATQTMLQSRRHHRVPALRPGSAVPAPPQGRARLRRRLRRRREGQVMTMLPDEFSDLEPFAAKWSLPTEKERYAERCRARWTTCRRSTTPTARAPMRRRRTSTRSRSTPCPRTRPTCCTCSTRSSRCRSRSRSGSSRTSPTRVPRTSTSSGADAMTATMMAGARPKPPDHPVVLKADRMVDVDARTIVEPGVVVVER